MYRKLIKAIGLESRPECVLYGRAKGELQIGITNRRKADDMFSVVVSSKLEQSDTRQREKLTKTWPQSLPNNPEKFCSAKRFELPVKAQYKLTTLQNLSGIDICLVGIGSDRLVLQGH
uniref:Uncharacterized protein n=1 Tax=Magallana gigas TaxID=29159 RepID=K1PYQ5_MAGGI